MVELKWQTRRARFNHDWLKNQYLQKLGHWDRLLGDEVEDAAFERRFVADVLPDWERHGVGALEMVSEFESQMSPRALLNQPPLARHNAGTRAWLSELAHALWMVRYPVCEWVSDARGCVKAAACAYANLNARLGDHSDWRSVEALRPLRGDFERFRSACLDLAKAIEKFPDRILVV